jgi:hypothetical protein
MLAVELLEKAEHIEEPVLAVQTQLRRGYLLVNGF